MILGIIKQPREETLDDLSSGCHEGFVLGDCYLALHESKYSVLWKSWEDEAWFSLGQDLHGIGTTSKSKAKSEYLLCMLTTFFSNL
jgi:hypothetical protein